MKPHFLRRPGLWCLLLGLSTMGYAQSKGGRWQFENLGLDTAVWDARADNGTLQQQASFSAMPPVPEGGAYLWLDSANVHDYFLVDDSDDLDFTNENIGISAWIYPVRFDRVHFIITKGDQFPTPKTTNYSLRLADGRKLEFLIRDANDRAQRVTSSFTIPLQQWTFVAAFYDFNARKVYLWNNPRQAVDTLNFNQAIFANDDPLAIGTWFRSDPAAPSINDFDGRIDDVRLSGRLADILPQPTAVAEGSIAAAATVPSTLQVFPNPVFAAGEGNDGMVQFTSNLESITAIAVYNVLGQTVFSASHKAAVQPFRFMWNLRNEQGEFLQTGIYWVRITNGRNLLTKKFYVIR